MRQGIVCFILMFGITLKAHAGEFEGYYIGGALGENVRTGIGSCETNISVAFPVPQSSNFTTGTDAVSNDFNLKRPSNYLQFWLGYGKECCLPCYGSVYWGAEVFGAASRFDRSHTIESDNFSANFTNTRTTISTSLLNEIKVKMNTWEIGFDLRPGYLVTPDFLLFLKIGYVYNRQSLRNSTTYTWVDNTPESDEAVLDQANNRNGGGFRFGFGLERRFCGCYSIRADYVHTHYSQVRVNGFTETAFTSLANTTSLKLSGYTFTVGLSYHWF